MFPDSVGNGGTITVNAPKVSILNGATIVAHTYAQGNAGNIIINANKVLLDGVGSNSRSSGLGSAAFELSNGEGGAILINTDSLNVTNGATLFVSSFGEKDAGSVTINATGAVSFDGIGANGFSSNAFSTVEAESTGNGGEINITANSLSVENGAVVGASTSGQGKGGDININVNTLQIQSGGQILTTSRSSGNAGNISVNAASSTTIIGSDETFPERLARIGRPIVRNEGSASGIFANTDVNSTGSGGNIKITTGSLSINEGALVNATNQGNGVAGNTGGNITLDIADNLTLGDNSTISAQALKNANGGNINIDAGFILAFPNQNNDIVANAARGRGGNISITTNAIFGIEERNSTLINNTNDIDASSEFGLDGRININLLDVNPAEGIEDIPRFVIDPDKLVVFSLCSLARDSEFYFTAKGGNAPNLVEVRDEGVIAVDLVEPVTLEEEEELLSSGGRPRRTGRSSSGSKFQSQPLRKTFTLEWGQRKVHQDRGAEGAEAAEVDREEIVEAQGWILHENGVVELVAYKTAPHGSPAQPKDTRVCPK